jgi:Tol biopolymer transport system component
MPEIRSLLERRMERVHLRPYGLEDFQRRRARKERRARIAAAAVAIVIASAVFGAAATAMLEGRRVPADRGYRPIPDAYAGPNGKILFNEDILQPDGSELVHSYTINPDGSDLAQVGPEGTYCGDNDDPWSPDGRTMVCTVFQSYMTVTTATMAADGSNYTVVSDPRLPHNFGCGAWSPDGSRLLCPFTNDWVYSVNPDGTDLVRLARISAGSGPSGFMRDGAHAYFTVQDPTEHRTLYAVSSDGTGGLTRLSPSTVSVHDNEYFDGVSADSSPDGSQAVFAADLVNGGGALYVASIDGSGSRRVRTPGLDPISAQWSPDGSWIAFSGRPSTLEHEEIYLVHPDGSGLRRITVPATGCSSLAPVWSRDSSMLLFETRCSTGSPGGSTTLETINLDGTGRSKVTDLAGPSAYGWGP